MNEPTGKKSADKKIISLADERKRREIQELIRLFETFYEKKEELTRPQT